MKFYMHWDMEGVSGLFTREQVWFWEAGARPAMAEEGRRLLMADVNSATAAVLEAGADQVIVCDTHHGGGNITIPEMLADPRVTYHGRSRAIRDGKSRWMPDLDESVDGLMLMGHHAKAGTEGAFLPHTWSLDWADFAINGQSVGEIGIEACFAGYWDVPLILVQGDEAGCREAETQFPGVVTAAVKRAESRDRCSGLDAEAARRLTAEKVAEAIQKARSGHPAPYKPSLPMRVSVRLSSTAAAEAAAAKPGARRVDEDTVEWVVERQCDLVKGIANAGVD
jgi:D-amino peptidase